MRAGSGSIAGVPLSPDALRTAIRAVRAATSAPFGVNLFAPPYLNEGAFEVVLEERPAVFSFTFGPVDPAPLREARDPRARHGDDGRGGAALDVDVVVAQGAEAGGHRGTFLGSFEDALVPLAELLPEVVAAVDVPVHRRGRDHGRHDVARRARSRRAGRAARHGVSLHARVRGAAGVARRAAHVRHRRDAGVLRPPAALHAHRSSSGRCTARRRSRIRSSARAVEARADAERFYLGGTGAGRARELPVGQSCGLAETWAPAIVAEPPATPLPDLACLLTTPNGDCRRLE